MDVVHYYNKLNQHFASEPRGSSIQVTMQELEDIWECTRRNAQLLVQKMKELGLIDWQSGLGRGNTSRLVLVADAQELLLDKAKELALKGHVGEAFGLLHAHTDPLAESQFSDWLAGQFGAQKASDHKDILRFPFYRPVLDLEPLFVIRRTETHLIRQILNTLVEFDTTGHVIKPGLAHYWESDREYSEWTFYLRKGVLFHHGKVMTAEDVQFTFQRFGQLNPPDWFMANVARVEVLSDISVRFHLSEPNALFLHLLASERFSIVPKDLDRIAATRDIRRMPVGTGPFVMKENSDNGMILEANERYFQGRPMMDRIEIWVWPNYLEHLKPDRLQERDTQVLYFEPIGKKKTGTLLTRLEEGSTYLTFNLSRDGILHDMKLREAIHLAINREQMVKELGGKREQPSSGFNPYDHDEAYGRGGELMLARACLAESAYRGEMLTLYTYEMTSNELDTEWIRRACEDIGVKMEVHVMPIRELTNPSVFKQADMIYAGEVLGNEPSVSLIEMYRSHYGYIRNHLDDAARDGVDRALSEVLAEPDYTVRRILLRRIEDQLKRDHHLLFMYHSIHIIGHDQSLGGITLDTWGKINYKDVWVKR
ncbi:ABC transporter substrate-binding protein [Paenibacillus cellulositrophicus]|uniref:ABC transporter substrate-binding protein n=1 Tax=Paenibacillus cellulositrophicus TaxID=562959 RepID=UPI00142EA7F5|nr:ABC transporter substrate-binding protein [Paenibacillus cellulositrophicus]